jgi:hypothetical protein
VALTVGGYVANHVDLDQRALDQQAAVYLTFHYSAKNAP